MNQIINLSRRGFLKAGIAGGGDVIYGGSPKITQKIMGSGSVRAGT